MKRFALFLLVLVLPIYSGLAQDVTDPFWKPTEAQLAAWRVIDDVEEGATLTFWTMSLSPTFDEYMRQLVENFQAVYPEATVNWRDQAWNTLQADSYQAFSSNTAPDVLNLSPLWIPALVENGWLMDMDAALVPYPDLRAQYVEGAWTTQAVDGVSYHIPWYIGLSNFLAYNNVLLADLGMTPADLPTTWQELYTFAQKVRQESDFYALSLNFAGGAELNLLPYLLYNDVPAFDAEGKIALNTGTAAEDLQLWVNLLQEDLIPRESLREDHRLMVERFAAGETVIMISASYMLYLTQATNPEVYAQVRVAPGVVGRSGKQPMEVQSLVISQATPYPKAALALATFVSNPEAQAAFSQEVGVFPSNLLSYENPFFQTSDPANPMSLIRPLALDYVSQGENRSAIFPNDIAVRQAITEAQNAALLGEKSPQQALDDMVAAINALIAE